jgi:hypothetical protein
MVDFPTMMPACSSVTVLLYFIRTVTLSIPVKSQWGLRLVIRVPSARPGEQQQIGRLALAVNREAQQPTARFSNQLHAIFWVCIIMR